MKASSLRSYELKLLLRPISKHIALKEWIYGEILDKYEPIHFMKGLGELSEHQIEQKSELI